MYCIPEGNEEEEHTPHTVNSQYSRKELNNVVGGGRIPDSFGQRQSPDYRLDQLKNTMSGYTEDGFVTDESNSEKKGASEEEASEGERDKKEKLKRKKKEMSKSKLRRIKDKRKKLRK